MPSGGGTLLFVITSTPSTKAELLGSKLLAVNNGVAVDVSNAYDSRIGRTANTKLSRNLHHKKDCVGYLHHKKDCVGYLVKATANVTSTGALSGSPWSLFGRHIGPVLNVKGVRDTRGQLGGPTDTTLCITHTSVVQDTCS